MITIWRVGAATVLLALLGIAGCAPTASTTPAPITGIGAPGALYGVIESARPVAAEGTARTPVLAAMGVQPAPARAATEFVLRTDDGQTLSVVQTSHADMMPGQKALLIPGPPPRVAPIGLGSGGSPSG